MTAFRPTSKRALAVMFAAILATGSTVVTAPPANALPPISRPYQAQPQFRPPAISRPYPLPLQQPPSQAFPRLHPGGAIEPVVPPTDPNPFDPPGVDVPGTTGGGSSFSGNTNDGVDLKTVLVVGGLLLSLTWFFMRPRRT